MLLRDIADTAHIVNDDLSYLPPVWPNLHTDVADSESDITCSETESLIYTSNSPKTRLYLQAVEEILDGRKIDLYNLPPILYWRTLYGLKFSSGSLLRRFQYDFQRGNICPKCSSNCRFVAKPAAYWQASSDLTEHEWPNAIKGTRDFIDLQVHMVGSSKQTFLRPTEMFMKVFGLTLADYDAAGRLQRTVQPGRPGKGKSAAKDVPISADDQAGADRWRNAGGYWK